MDGEVTILPAEPAMTAPPTPSAAEDLDLLRKAARGDGQAFHKLSIVTGSHCIALLFPWQGIQPMPRIWFRNAWPERFAV